VGKLTPLLSFVSEVGIGKVLEEKKWWEGSFL